MNLVKLTPTQLIFQKETRHLPKGTVIEPDAQLYLWVIVGAFCYLQIIGIILDQHTFTIETITANLPFFLIGNLCLFVAWRRFTGNKSWSISYIFDIESNKLTLRTNYRRRSTKVEYRLEEFQCIQIDHWEQWSNLMIKAKGGWGLNFALTSSAEDDRLLNITKIISEFTNIPFCDAQLSE